MRIRGVQADRVAEVSRSDDLVDEHLSGRVVDNGVEPENKRECPDLPDLDAVGQDQQRECCGDDRPRLWVAISSGRLRYRSAMMPQCRPKNSVGANRIATVTPTAVTLPVSGSVGTRESEEEVTCDAEVAEFLDEFRMVHFEAMRAPRILKSN